MQTRDVTYVDNVVDVFYRCATAQRKFNGKAFNAGTGASVSNNEILEWFKLNFPNCEIVTAPPRAGDVKHTLADVVHSDIFLGYKPIISFWEGLELTKTWALNSSLF
jgi:nucleoside-diphosphate-sugar epimerase